METNKKGNRKKKRFAARLHNKGITCTDVQKPFIVLCNAGQATGLEKCHIQQLIADYGLDISLPKFIAEKGESHSFLVFSKTDDAYKFYESCNGLAKISENGPPLYLSFVENVPTNEITCKHGNPKGLTLLSDFLSIEEEAQYIDLFDWNEDSSGSLKNRQVKHYGFEFRYGSNDVDLNCPLLEKIPEECDILWRRLKEKGFDLGVPDQLTVNKYKPGQGIPSHVDNHSPFGGTILSVSLGSSVVMEWKHHTGKHVVVEVPARSLMIMQDEARYDWQHGIQPRTWDPIIEYRSTSSDSIKVITSDTVPRQTRISLTFRWTRTGSCVCEYRTLCDSACENNSQIQEDIASNLEELHVHQVYKRIAGHFSTTRHKPWPRVVEFMASVPAGAVVLDLGAGNGKNILPRDDIYQLAGERSSGLLSECRQHIQSVGGGGGGGGGADCVRLDLLTAALRDRCADAVICIAVIHHFSSKVRRLQAVSTIARLLRPGGRALITVWAKDQTNSNYLLKTKPEQTNGEVLSVAGVTLPVHQNRTQFRHSDLLVPWKLRTANDNKLSRPETTFLRYYHVFEETELEDLCREVPDLTVEKSFYEEGNRCVVCKKIQ